ncbi:MAG: MBL fold metallo-hydrolase [Planctomycetaceae bacterium]
MPRILYTHLALRVAAMLVLGGAAQSLQADTGKPIAVRWWGQALVSIETYWNLTIVIDPFSTTIGYADPELTADLVLITHEHPDHNHAKIVQGNPVVVHGLNDDGSVRSIHHALDRLPNSEQPTWKDARLRIARSEHAAVVTTIAAWHDNEQGAQRGAVAMFLIEVDGIRILHCGDLGQHLLTDEQLAKLGEIDLLIIPVGGVYTVDGPQAAAVVKQVNPRWVMPIHYMTPDLKFELQPVQLFLDALGSKYQAARPVGNTIAIRALDSDEPSSSAVMLPGYVPWAMPDELAELFARKDAANRASQKVFAPLSANQMNFRPSNGTHTPRWNAEHMMGRELGFFTQIFAAVDPELAWLDLNPKQMPPDYVAAHPDWTGAEEARQMERVTAFTRRFAYLLDGLDLDAKAPGSRWTPRGLLKQMDEHYTEHTANVVKKFDLPEFPKE